VAVTKQKQQGNKAELAVALRLTEMGASVAWPYGDGAAWDLLADFDGKLSRIQVKSGNTANQIGTVRVNLYRGYKSTVRYTSADADFIVAVAADIGTYIIPVADITKTRLYTWTGGQRRGQLPHYEQYKEAWHLLK
jgi:hypothetical protein